MKRKTAGVAYVVRDTKVLAVWNKTFNGWCFPGGKTEEDEEHNEAVTANRELEEETGIDARGQEGPIFVAPSDVDPERMVHVFRVTEYEGEPYEAESGCPTEWMSQEAYLVVTCFPRYYAAFFSFYPVLAERQPTLFVEPSEPAVGRPKDSACACKEWPCSCACHGPGPKS